MEKEFDAKQAEKEELNLLNDIGESFTVLQKVNTREGIFGKWFPKYELKPQKYSIKHPTLGVIDRLSLEYIEIEFDENKLTENPLQESKRLLSLHSKRLAKIVAIAVLNRECKDEQKVNDLSEIFYESLTNNDVLMATLKITKLTGYENFIASIRLISMSHRTTKPKESLVEQED